MGVEYYVGCKDCKVSRDLGKFYTLSIGGGDVKDRETALKFQEDIQKQLFRSGLLVSFMGKHIGHNCIVYTDSHDEIEDIFDPDMDGKTVEDFWR